MTAEETFVRPNGKPYRPRQPGLTVRTWENEYPDERQGVIVFGTLDPERAVDLADEEARRQWGGSYTVDSGTPCWVRDGFQGSERTWLHDDKRGRPCVEFEAGER